MTLKRRKAKRGERRRGRNAGDICGSEFKGEGTEGRTRREGLEDVELKG